MDEIFREAEADRRSTDRIPEEFEGIQVNTCKNPSCINFNAQPLIIHKNKKVN